MKKFAVLVLGLIALLSVVFIVVAQDTPTKQENASVQGNVGSIFTYQGLLTEGSGSANGVYDFRFRLYDASSGGNQIGTTVTQDNLAVSDGLFTTDLDFGAEAFTGEARYLEIGVRAGSSTGTYETLAPRQELHPAPYAIHAATAGEPSLKYFEGFATIPTSGAFDWESFTIGNNTYLVVANRTDGTTDNLNSKIYRWNGTAFIEIQSIATNSARDWEFLTIGTDAYLTVANYSDGSSNNIYSKIYRWNGSSFIEFQSILTTGPPIGSILLLEVIPT